MPDPLQVNSGAIASENAIEMNFSHSQSQNETPVPHIPLESQIDSSSNPSIEGNAGISKENEGGIMNRFFGVQKAAIQEKSDDNNF